MAISSLLQVQQTRLCVHHDDDGDGDNGDDDDGDDGDDGDRGNNGDLIASRFIRLASASTISAMPPMLTRSGSRLLTPSLTLACTFFWQPALGS